MPLTRKNARLLVDRFEETVRDPTWYGWSRRVLAVEIDLTEVETIMPADLAHHMRQSFLYARNSKQYNELVKWRPIQSPGRMVYTWGYYVDIVSEKPDYGVEAICVPGRSIPAVLAGIATSEGVAPFVPFLDTVRLLSASSFFRPYHLQ